jgi:hypothetical protein
MTDRPRSRRARRSPPRDQAAAAFDAKALLEEIAADRGAPGHVRVQALKILFRSTAVEDAADARKKARAEREAEKMNERALELLRGRR